MFIKSIKINNYRNFYNTTINFDEEMNIIVGANNSGKTNILRIISFLSTNQKMWIDDLNKNNISKNWAVYKNIPPFIEIEYDINHLMDYEKLDSGLTKLEDFIIYDENGNIDSNENNFFTIKAIIKLKYELDSRLKNDYISEMNSVNSYNEFMQILKKYEENYEINFYNCTSNEIIEKKKIKNIFNIEYVDANRDVEDITINTKKYVKDKINKSKNSIRELSNSIDKIIKFKLKNVSDSINKDIEKDQKQIGVSNGKNNFVSSFEFNSDFTDFFKYELQNDQFNYLLPLDSNGLGYNNLIYIRNAMNLKQEDEFNLLLIEEPEAHLHPNMQYKLIKYIEYYRKNNENFNQVFITTHSSNVTASANLDNIILINYIISSNIQPNVISVNIKNNFMSDYIKKNYNILIEQNTLYSYKNYLQKFLDVTRSDLLFAEKVILVEGISEKIYVPHIFEEKYQDTFINNYISIIEVGGITFNNFLPLFIGTNKKVLCISDVDYEFDGDENFQNHYDDAKEKKLKEMGINNYKNLLNIYFCTQKKGGSTFEKEIFIENYESNCIDLLKLAFPNQTLKNLIIDYEKEIKTFEFWENEAEGIINDKRIWKGIGELVKKFQSYSSNSNLNKKDLVKYFLCELFYKYIKNKKGDFSLTMCLNNWIQFPSYILEGLKWLKE